MKIKKLFLLPFFLVIVCYGAFADRSQAIDYLNLYLEAIQVYDFNLSDYGDGGEGDSWWCWSMKPGNNTEVKRMFFKGNNYALVACGDDSATDVDIEVYDENWNLVFEDDEIESFAVVMFSPANSGIYHIKTTYYKGDGRAHVGFFISYQNN